MKDGQGYTEGDLQAVSDHPEWTAVDCARAQPFHVVFPDLVTSLHGHDQVTPGVGEADAAVVIDRDLVRRFKEDGPAWEARSNATLRRAVENAA